METKRLQQLKAEIGLKIYSSESNEKWEEFMYLYNFNKVTGHKAEPDSKRNQTGKAKTNITKLRSCKRSFRSVLSSNCVRCSASRGSFRCLTGPEERWISASLTATTVGWEVGVQTPARSCNRLKAWNAQLMVERTWLKPANTEETKHNGSVPQEKQQRY